MTIGEEIKKIRTLHSWSVKTLEQESGVVSSLIYKIENNTISPSVATVNKLLAPFGKCIVIGDLDMSEIDSIR